jgi:predicted RNase H-like HicB family nuclease
MLCLAMAIHVGDDQHAHGVTIPDFPGCFSAADEWEDLPRMIQEAAEVYFEGENTSVPAPTSLEQLAANPEYQGGVWLLVDIDLAKLKVKAKRVNITMSENLLNEIGSPQYDLLGGNGAEADPPTAGLADGWIESFSFIICCNIKALTELFIVVTLNP